MTNILLVEDDVSLNETICLFLEAKGYNILSSFTGRTAVEMLQKQQPGFDLVLCDINLPDILGYDVYRSMKTVMPKMPRFIFLTAYADKAFIEDGMSLGADDYVTKPFAFDDLLRVIEKHTMN